MKYISKIDILKMDMDGQCGYRALSYHIFGTQKQYEFIKRTLLLAEKNDPNEVPGIHIDDWLDEGRIIRFVNMFFYNVVVIQEPENEYSGKSRYQCKTYEHPDGSAAKCCFLYFKKLGTDSGHYDYYAPQEEYSGPDAIKKFMEDYPAEDPEEKSDDLDEDLYEIVNNEDFHDTREPVSVDWSHDEMFVEKGTEEPAAKPIEKPVEEPAPKPAAEPPVSKKRARKYTLEHSRGLDVEAANTLSSFRDRQDQDRQDLYGNVIRYNTERSDVFMRYYNPGAHAVLRGYLPGYDLTITVDDMLRAHDRYQGWSLKVGDIERSII
jgi:hypothetical protein